MNTKFDPFYTFVRGEEGAVEARLFLRLLFPGKKKWDPQQNAQKPSFVNSDILLPFHCHFGRHVIAGTIQGRGAGGIRSRGGSGSLKRGGYAAMPQPE